MIIGRKSTSDFECDCSLTEKICCIRPDQLGLGCAALLKIYPACQSRLELENGSHYGASFSFFFVHAKALARIGNE